MTNKVKGYLMAAAFVLTLAVGSAVMIGVDETLSLFQGLVGIAKEAKK